MTLTLTFRLNLPTFTPPLDTYWGVSLVSFQFVGMIDLQKRFGLSKDFSIRLETLSFFILGKKICPDQTDMFSVR